MVNNLFKTSVSKKVLNIKEQNQIDWNYFVNYGLKVIETEIRSYPCFGLVSAKNNGCHTDMNFALFIKSKNTFRFYFYDIINLVLSDNNLNFTTLRALGQKQEKRMLQATNNVNTHKGLIFNFGIIFYIVAFAKYHNIASQQWNALIKNLTAPLADDFSTFNNKTKGEQMYHLYKIKGARGIALDGYEIIFNQALPFLKKYDNLSLKKQSLLLLVFYLSKVADTTLISKIGYEESFKIMKTAEKWLEILEQKNWKKFQQIINQVNEEYRQKKVSPGGCADLCVVTLFLQEFMKQN